MFNISVFCDLSPNEYIYSRGLNFVTLLFIYFFFFSITCLLVFIIKILPAKRKKNCVYNVPLLEFIRLVLIRALYILKQVKIIVIIMILEQVNMLKAL